MKSGNYSFPHPVLGRNDDVEGLFQTNLEYLINREEIILTCQSELHNKTLEELISSAKAKCCIEVTCGATKFKDILDLKNGTDEFRLPANELRGRVEIGFYVFACAKIDDYLPQGANKDYGDYRFGIGEGDILARDFATYAFLAEKTWEKLMSVSSFMQIVESDKDEGPVEYNLGEDKIIILLSKKDYANYKNLHLDENLASTFHTSIALPALIFAVTSIIKSDSPYREMPWYLHLQTRIENSGELKKTELEYQNVPKICQAIFDDPLKRELVDLNKFIKKYREGEE